MTRAMGATTTKPSTQEEFEINLNFENFKTRSQQHTSIERIAESEANTEENSSANWDKQLPLLSMLLDTGLRDKLLVVCNC